MDFFVVVVFLFLTAAFHLFLEVSFVLTFSQIFLNK